MAFKKKTKPKKSKKSSKKNKDSEWAFEGGVSFDNVSEEDPKAYKRIHTQEKDERFRRGRLKVEDRKRKQYFINKMSKRVRFSDVWKSEEAKQKEEDSENDSAEHQKPVLNEANPLPVLDRLQFFLQNSLSQSSHARVDDRMMGNSDEEREERRINKQISTTMMVNSTSNSDRDFLVFRRSDHDNDGVEDYDVNDDQIEDDPTSSLNEQENPYTSWYFQSKVIFDRDKPQAIKELSSRKKAQSVDLITFPYNHEEKGQLYQAAHPQLPVQEFPELEKLSSIPGLYKLWKSLHPSPMLNQFSKQLFPKLLTYSDVFIEGRNHINDWLLLETLLMHGLFHVVRSRAVVVKHNQRLKEKENHLQKKLGNKNPNKKGIDLEVLAAELQQEQSKSASKSKKKNKANPTPSATTSDEVLSAVNELEEDSVMKDQGFVRPRLLILTPLRCTAKHIVQSMIQILGPNTSISGLSKFIDEYSDPEATTEEEDSIDYGERYYHQKDQLNRSEEVGRRPVGEKPDDWKALFHGNIDDDFKMGIQINPNHGKGTGPTKGVYLRLFSDFYQSDIIIASPIGLKLALDATNSSHNNSDILTSIEQVILHQLDVLSLQNFEHLHDIFRRLNTLPRTSHESTDYSRVRPYFLNGMSAYYRQLMITSAINTPELQAFFRQYAQSHAGWIRIKRHWPSNGMITNVYVPRVKQIFQIIPLAATTASSAGSSGGAELVESYEERKFQFFKEKVLAKLLLLKQSRVLLVIPSYFDFIKIRNEMMAQEINAAYISEYSRESEISRGRARFYQGLKDILVYSGRAHFYRRFRIRGAKHIIFYSLPEYPHFYSEFVNMLGDFRPVAFQEDGNQKEEAAMEEIDTEEEYTALALCSELDAMSLERVVGKRRCEQMLGSNKSTFLFFS